VQSASVWSNVVGLGGLLQPFADGFKLFLKETISTVIANNSFHCAPIISLS
jgi:NADH:ubiquinone oxidoreductase subunit H